MWQRTFVATSILIGASVEDAIAGLADGEEAALEELAGTLRTGSRPARARALATIAGEIVDAIGAVTLR